MAMFALEFIILHIFKGYSIPLFPNFWTEYEWSTGEVCYLGCLYFLSFASHLLQAYINTNVGKKVTGKKVTEKKSQIWVGKKVTGKKVTKIKNFFFLLYVRNGHYYFYYY